MDRSEVALSRHEKRRRQRALKEKQKRLGTSYPPTITIPNRKSELKTVAEEKSAIQLTTEEQVRIYGQLLPGLLKKLARIPDPRNPKRIKHQITVMMFYGIMMFVFQKNSRRETNREMTTPQLLQNLQAFFPKLMEMPHQDSLYRLLEKMNVGQIETSYLEMLRHLIRKKTFKNLLHKKRYLVAVDGTQKYVMKELWDERYLRRKTGGGSDYQYYAYVLEAVLILSNGMVLPLMSEFLENSPELEKIKGDEEWKQDCELKAFYRMARRLKEQFPKLPITLLLDGLYASGPVMEICRRNKWHFMIVLKDNCLPAVWREVNGLMRLDKEGEYRLERVWQGRNQVFRWMNGIEYEYRLGKRKNMITVHFVMCEESWEGIDANGNPLKKTGRHAWISNVPISRNNVHRYCNLAARKRWLHENNILKEKCQGYGYEHIFAHNWNAMRGYHYLMHIARMLNEMALHSVNLIDHVSRQGIQPFIKQFREVMAHRELDTKRIWRLVKSPGQLRLVQDEKWKTSQVAV